MVDHPFNTVFVDNTDVNKADVRGLKTRLRVHFESVSDVRNTDLVGQFAGIYVAALDANFDYDGAAVLADDGLTVIVSNDGYQFVAASTSGAVQNVSAADKFLYSTAVNTWAEASITSAGRDLVAGANAAEQRTRLGLGTAATKNTGTSGNVVPLLDGANIFSAAQTINANAASFPAGLTSGIINLMAGDATASLINLVSFGANSNFTQARAGGTAASSTALASGDMIGQNVFKGYDGSAWGSNQVTIRSYATETWTSSAHGADLRFGTTANGATTITDRCRVDQDGTFRAAADNTYNLGNATYRWKEVFAATGSINTSDARHKTAVRAMSPEEIATAKALSKEIGIFQFLDSVAKKGSDKARLHTGMTVQRIIEIFQSNGLDPFRYAFVCFDKWPASTDRTSEVVDGEGNVVENENVIELPAGEIYGLRMDQLLMFIARGFEARLAALEA